MNNIKKLLDLYYIDYNILNSSADPVWNLNKVKTLKDKEVLAFIISCYSYGNIAQINNFINKVLAYTENEIFDFISSYKRSENEKNYNFYYRFNTNQDFFDLISVISEIINGYGSLKKLFLHYYDINDNNIINALVGFTSEIRRIAKSSEKSFEYLVPDPKQNSTCKRLFMFMRWMVRKDNIDLGLWNKEIHTSKLIIPVDTHVYRRALLYNLVSRKSMDLKFAIELTEKLKEFDPDDPVKYDFALCHLGVDKIKI